MTSKKLYRLYNIHTDETLYIGETQIDLTRVLHNIVFYNHKILKYVNSDSIGIGLLHEYPDYKTQYIHNLSPKYQLIKR
jgi:hypothetical protein